MAGVVESHKDLPGREKIGEAEILYLADKMTDGTTISTLEARMASMESRFPKGSDALAGAARRIAAAGDIARRVEAAVGKTLDELMMDEMESE